ncbi:flagellar biosynthesis anti-sigma factor FlgM [Geoalkalibacter halelectricus]|uniref:Negative regulator of flagellin synthesis n=1 Tax=Geoalkalibacter halelectricus TaxID=2847045 RepID=A0ABY5ZH02_9BACT|nr:flagellar biosynthesis anti-sigma factor FlgM [Geoalkalibacter halelectricus]MDO3378049.1 flagellar biosynthesis anti-sigma factor FlgM [Geoalkalibacter halelectricus]UWZ78348.1 flagellar biosynthesis anti-sigma factor FlgM [Geoalkalibacter halelectricus]
MSIKKIFGNQIVPPLVPPRATQKAGGGKPGAAQAKDKVDFSSVLQQVNKAKESKGMADVQRAEKVASLKAQIAAGTYRPDLHKVAESLLKHIREDDNDGRL